MRPLLDCIDDWIISPKESARIHITTNRFQQPRSTRFDLAAEGGVRQSDQRDNLELDGFKDLRSD
jgi:hypothetical protein